MTTLRGFFKIDLILPSIPANLSVDATTQTTIDLSWDASTDNTSGVAGYRLYRDGGLLIDQPGLTFQDSSLTPDVDYIYNVMSYDNSGNESALSSDLTTYIPYAAEAIYGDGQTISRRGGNLTGAVDHDQFLFSVWVYQVPSLWQNVFGGFVSLGDNNGRIKFTFGGTARRVTVRAHNQFNGVIWHEWWDDALVWNEWNHLLVARSGETGHIYLNGSPLVNLQPANSDDNDFELAEWTLHAGTSDNEGVNQGHMAELYFTNEYLNITQQANRDKFSRDDGNGLRPTYLNSNGSRPTGTVPWVYFSGDAAKWNAGTNEGSGGDFPVTGAYTDSNQEPVRL